MGLVMRELNPAAVVAGSTCVAVFCALSMRGKQRVAGTRAVSPLSGREIAGDFENGRIGESRAGRRGPLWRR